MLENGTFEGTLNVELFYQTLARIIGEKEGVELTVTVRPKDVKGVRPTANGREGQTDCQEDPVLCGLA